MSSHVPDGAINDAPPSDTNRTGGGHNRRISFDETTSFQPPTSFGAPPPHPQMSRDPPFGLRQDSSGELDGLLSPGSERSGGPHSQRYDRTHRLWGEYKRNGWGGMLREIRRRRAAKVAGRHEFNMTPFSKFSRYARLPCKFILNVIILSLILVVIMHYEMPRARTSHFHKRAMHEFFMPDGYDTPYAGYYHVPTYQFFRTDEVMSFLNDTVHNYYTYVPNVLGVSMFPAELDPKRRPHPPPHGPEEKRKRFYTQTVETDMGKVEDYADVAPTVGRYEVTPPMMTVNMYASGLRQPHHHYNVEGSQVRTFNLTYENPYGPLKDTLGKKDVHLQPGCRPRKDIFTGEVYLPCRGDSTQSMFDGVQSLSVKFSFREIRVDDPESEEAATFHWHISLDIDVRSQGMCVLGMSVHSTANKELKKVTVGVMVMSALVFFAIWDLLLRLRVIYRFKQFRKENPAYFECEKSDTSTDGSAEYPAANPLRHSHTINRHTLGIRWLAWAIAADLLAIVAGCLQLNDVVFSETSGVLDIRNVVIGLAGFFSSTLLISYFRHIARFYFLIETMRTAAPHTALFMIGVIPLFFAYAIFGYVVFGSYAPMFNTFSQSCTTLEAIIHGDSLLMSFQESGATNFFPYKEVSRWYCFSFMALFIWITLNVVLVIVQDAYYHTKRVYGLYDHPRPANFHRHVLTYHDIEACVRQLRFIHDTMRDGVDGVGNAEDPGPPSSAMYGTDASRSLSQEPPHHAHRHAHHGRATGDIVAPYEGSDDPLEVAMEYSVGSHQSD